MHDALRIGKRLIRLKTPFIYVRTDGLRIVRLDETQTNNRVSRYLRGRRGTFAMLLRVNSTGLDSGHPQNGGHKLAGILTLLGQIEIGRGIVCGIVAKRKLASSEKGLRDALDRTDISNWLS